MSRSATAIVQGRVGGRVLPLSGSRWVAASAKPCAPPASAGARPIERSQVCRQPPPSNHATGPVDSRRQIHSREARPARRAGEACPAVGSPAGRNPRKRRIAVCVPALVVETAPQSPHNPRPGNVLPAERERGLCRPAHRIRAPACKDYADCAIIAHPPICGALCGSFRHGLGSISHKSRSFPRQAHEPLLALQSADPGSGARGISTPPCGKPGTGASAGCPSTRSLITIFGCLIARVV